MVGLAYDCLNNPLGAVRLTFEKAVAAAEASDGGFDPAAFTGKDWGAIDLFRNFLFDQGGLAQVPLLDRETLGLIQPNSLVRFRGMVQDMPGVEYYAGAYKDASTWRTNKFADNSHSPIDNSCEMQLWERRLLYCVPVPGRNVWTLEASSAESLRNRYNSTLIGQHGEKRQREHTDEDMESNCLCDSLSGSPSSSKKQRDELPDQSLATQDHATFSKEQFMPDFSKSFPCLVKIYDSPDSDLKLNEVFEFLGVFTFDPDLAIHKNDLGEAFGDLDDVMTHLPPSKVPHLHCLVHRKLAVQDFFHCPHNAEPNPSTFKEIRESLLRYLTTVLGNDGLAAHCMLLHLLSKVYSRVNDVAVGKLSLNLSGFTKENMSVFGTQLNTAIQNLLPFSQHIPLTVQYLNTAILSPRKDYQTNRLVAGVMQLAEGTHLTIDETQLQSGTLDSVGVSNVRVLKNLIEWQNVEYEFDFFKMEMAADCQVLILSQGKSNILPADLVVPFQPSAIEAALNASAGELQAWRWYIATVKSCFEHQIEQDIQMVIENDIVAIRQEDRNLGADDFSRLLTMARLVSASFGETKLSLEHWQLAKEMERLRKERIQLK